jgi:hypothetical protein
VTRGTRPKKPSSSRVFAREARGVWGLKTENCKFLSFQAGNNYQKNLNKILFYFILYFFIYFFLAFARTANSVRRERRGEGREVMRASARTFGRVHADGFLPRIKPHPRGKRGYGRTTGRRPRTSGRKGRPDRKDVRTVIFIQKRPL